MANDITPSTEQGRAEWNAELSKVASQTTDFSSFEVDSIEPVQEQATESDNSTLTNDSENQPSQTVEDRGNSPETEAKTETTSQDETQTKTPDTNKQEEAVSKRTDTDPTNQKKPSQAQIRIQELVAKNKELEARLTQVQSGKPAVEQKPEHAIPPPYEKKPELYKSNFTEEQLEQAIASRETTDETKELAKDELNKIRDNERRMTRWEAWEARNQQAFQKKQADEVYYTQKAVEALPELNIPDSPAIKEFQRLMGMANELHEGIMKNPKSRLYLAQWTRDRLASTRVDTVSEENKKLKDEIQTLKKARQPLVASGKQEVGEISESTKAPTVSSFAEKLKLAGVTRR